MLELNCLYSFIGLDSVLLGFTGFLAGFIELQKDIWGNRNVSSAWRHDFLISRPAVLKKRPDVCVCVEWRGLGV